MSKKDQKNQPKKDKEKNESVAEKKEKDSAQDILKQQKKSANAKKLSKILKKTQAKKMAAREMMRQQSATEIKKNLPSTNFSLPVIALKQGLLFPSTEIVLNFGRDISVKAVKKAAKEKKLVVLVGQKDPDVEAPKAKDLYRIGTLAVIERTLKSDGNLSALVRGIKRVEVVDFQQFEPYILAEVNQLEEKKGNSEEATALANHLKKQFQKIVQMGKPVEFLSFIKLMSGVSKSELADQVASTLNLSDKGKQRILASTNVVERLSLVNKHLNHEMKVIEIEKDVVHKTQAKFDKHMRESILRERLNTIKKELGEYDDTEDIVEEYQQQLTETQFSDEIKEKVKKEINRLQQMSPNNPESGYIRSWLETIFDLPWGIKDDTEIDIKKAEKTLNKSHYGLKDVKDRILEYIAVLQLREQNQDEEKDNDKKDENKGKKSKSEKSTDTEKNSKVEDSPRELPTILCFVGPPGVGKTSIGRAIAKALNRKFTKISLGGIRDEAEIRGHRRTYVGAMTGRIIKGIKQAGSMNPIFILDEIDKVGKDFRGDPSSALLEVLDPEQNKDFEDHYLDVPFDLSDVIFITTANTLDTIPPALLDRLEIIRYPGYTFEDKFQIAKNHLLEKVYYTNGLTEKRIKITDATLKKVIHRYTREAGVRELERQLSKISRKIAKKIITKNRKKKMSVSPKMLNDLLGPEKYDLTLAEKEDQVGVATGLAWTRVGGDVLFIEVALTPGKGKIVLTGQLGDVMKESAQAALTFVKSQAETLGINPKVFDKTDVHIHVPEGAVSKDGPSAGITMATAIASAFTGRKVKKDLAMTGEITLRGRVLRIGGLKEKTIAAHLAGVRKIIIPEKNERNLVDVPDEVKKDIEFKPVAEALEVLKLALKK